MAVEAVNTAIKKAEVNNKSQKHWDTVADYMTTKPATVWFHLDFDAEDQQAEKISNDSLDTDDATLESKTLRP